MIRPDPVEETLRLAGLDDPHWTPKQKGRLALILERRRHLDVLKIAAATLVAEGPDAARRYLLGEIDKAHVAALPLDG